MANHKRGRCKRTVRCTMCTQDRWKGNGPERFKAKDKVKGKMSQWRGYLDGSVERID